MARKKPTRQPKVDLPQLSAVVERLNNAQALLRTSAKVLMAEEGGVACTVLEMGINQVEEIADDLERIDLHRRKGRRRKG